MAKDSRFLGPLNYTNSLNTLKSACSTASVLERGCIEDQVDFGDVILAAVTKFECPISVDVYRNSLPGVPKHRKPERRGKMETARTPMVSTIASDSDDSVSLGKEHSRTQDSDTLKLTAVHNSKNRLVEISMFSYRYQHIPRLMMQVLGVILSSYTKLNKFTIKDCLIDKYTIPELMNILSVTNITEVCLDSSFLPEANYVVLLQQVSSLQNLSLQRCNINDKVCKLIVSKLHFRQPAEEKLTILNLSSNRISDEGAKSIGEVLRNNRHLRYLNLADNQITDQGARHIFNALKEFPLTSDEIINKREQYMKYLKNFHAVYEKCGIDCENNAIKNKKSARRQMSSISLRSSMKSVRSKVSLSTESRSCMDKSFTNTKAESLTLNLVGPFDHPFRKSQVVNKDNDFYSKGNLVLCYLNLAYNNLMFPSLQRLLDVLEYQKIHRTDKLLGLIKVVFEGNNLPIKCTELDTVNVMFKEITRKLARSKTVL